MNIIKEIYLKIINTIISIYRSIKTFSFNSSTVIHFFFLFLLIMYSAPLITVLFCMWKSDFFKQAYPFITAFATTYDPNSPWRQSIANIIMPLITALSISLIKPQNTNTEIRISAFLLIIGLTLLIGTAISIISNQVIIAYESSLSPLKAYSVFKEITSSSIREYLSFFAILFGISATKIKE